MKKQAARFEIDAVKIKKALLRAFRWFDRFL